MMLENEDQPPALFTGLVDLEDVVVSDDEDQGENCALQSNPNKDDDRRLFQVRKPSFQ